MYVFSSNKIERKHTAAFMWKHKKLNQLVSVKPDSIMLWLISDISRGDSEGIWIYSLPLETTRWCSELALAKRTRYSPIPLGIGVKDAWDRLVSYLLQALIIEKICL